MSHENSSWPVSDYNVMCYILHNENSVAASILAQGISQPR